MPHPELAPLAVSPAEERQATARKPCAWDLTDQRGDTVSSWLRASLSGSLPGSPHLQNDEGDSSRGDSISQPAECWTPCWSVLSTPVMTYVIEAQRG